ncbi:diguanylate cyclase [Neptuniibacter halophilus]|uniref:diguanylate cyclase n=1 Tax=Neptuniibacter halophilus TaxID=651666 RepID=UPI00257445FB|nr:transporter substrate-binding domain-containing protein [Neptuniibacter halophilus]
MPFPPIKILLSALLTLLLLSQPVQAQLMLTDEEKAWLAQNPEIRVGESPAFQPLFVQQPDGSISGILPDTFDLIGEMLGVRFRYVADDWPAVLNALRDKRIDLIGSMNRETAVQQGFSSVTAPINFSSVVFARKSRDFQLYSSADLSGLRVAYHSKRLYLGRYLNQQHPRLTPIPADTPEAAINSLLNGTADVVLGMNIDSYLLAHNGLQNIEPAFVLHELSADSVIGVHPDNSLLAGIMQKAVAEIGYERSAAIMQKWAWLPENKVRLDNLTAEEKSYLQQHPVLRVQSLSTFPPFNFVENDQAKGYTVDYLNLVGEMLGVHVEFVKGKEWHEYLDMLREGSLDLIPHIAVTEEREQFIAFSRFNHIEYTSGVALNRNAGIETAADLEDKVVAVANKTFLHSYLSQHYPQFNLLLTGSTAEAVAAVSAGRADAVVGSLPALNYYIQKDWLSNIYIATVADLNMPRVTKLPMGVSQNNPVLLSILEKANEAIPHTQISVLKQKWMRNNFDQIMNAELTTMEQAYLQSRGPLQVCIDPDWLPLEGMVAGQPQGMSADYMNHFSLFTGAALNYVETGSWRESLAAGLEGRCDIYPLIMRTEEREATLSFSRPYLEIPLVLVTGIDQSFINDLHTLPEGRIGVTASFAVRQQLEANFPQLEFIGVEHARDGLRRVSEGELFGFAEALPVAGYWIQKQYLGDLKVSGKFEESWSLGLAVDREQPILHSIFDKAIQHLSPEIHQQIQSRWVAINYQHGVDYSLIWKLGLGFAVVALFLLYRNRAVAQLNLKLEMANQAISAQQRMVDRYVLITTFDRQGNITSANHAFCNALGYTPHELLGCELKALLSPQPEGDLFSEIWQRVREVHAWSGELCCLSSSGEDVFLDIHLEAVLEDNRVVAYRAICDNVSDKKRIEELSVTDKLTGLYNRLKIDEILAEQLERHHRYGNYFSVLLLDVDNFKAVNDQYGHDVGDLVLKTLAQVMQGTVRKVDVVGRWGGEEFVVICENTPASNALLLAEKLRQRVAETEFAEVGHKTISIGVSELQQGDTLNALFKRADQALYRAKRSGKNRVVAAESELDRRDQA